MGAFCWVGIKPATFFSKRQFSMTLLLNESVFNTVIVFVVNLFQCFYVFELFLFSGHRCKWVLRVFWDLNTLWLLLTTTHTKPSTCDTQSRQLDQSLASFTTPSPQWLARPHKRAQVWGEHSAVNQCGARPHATDRAGGSHTGPTQAEQRKERRKANRGNRAAIVNCSFNSLGSVTLFQGSLSRPIIKW